MGHSGLLAPSNHALRKERGGRCCGLTSEFQTNLVIPTEVEGAAVWLRPPQIPGLFLRPAQGMKNPRSHSPAGSRVLPLCHLDRSAPGFPTSQLSITATYAALREERRMTFTDRTTVHRKAGGAQWRDLQFRCDPKPISPSANLSPFVISTEAHPDFLPHSSR